MDLASYVRDIPDFPKKGIVFKDIMPLVGDPKALREAVRLMAEPWRDKGITKVVAVEARGFIFGGALAIELGAGFAALRKPGKLPYKTKQVTYDLEYGTDTICIHEDALGPRDKVLLADDLLATGGTVGGAAELVRELGAEIAGIAFLIELEFLGGRKRLPVGVPVESLVRYSAE
jgi:adenine phosphoribosyltransferase